MMLSDVLPNLAIADVLALGLLLALWRLLVWLIEHPPANRPSVTLLMADMRRDWMRTFVTRRVFYDTVHTIDDTVPVADVLGVLGADDPRPNASLQAIAAAYPAPPGWTVEESAPFASARRWSGAPNWRWAGVEMAHWLFWQKNSTGLDSVTAQLKASLASPSLLAPSPK